ncbi:MAG: MATE family efflux transporter [Actinomycetota bacterium]|nr:MATE family efflux transporter [Actinomycetota bacterium]MDH5277425.1 MATE family efflux transporter [Actinomycetota bacterium]
MRRAGQGLVGAAALIAAVTVVARVVGFVRLVVLARTVGTTCLGDAYATANAIPNIVYEVVIGGALAAAVVPLVAAGVAGHDPVRVRATVSALHGWVLLLLVPTTALMYLLSGLLVRLLIGSSNECPDPLMYQTSREMLAVFLLQIPVYGVTVVAQGALQAHRRFVAPALAPLVSSLVVIGGYLAYAQLAGESRGSLVLLSRPGFLALTVGTTLGVFVLLAVQVPSLVRQGLIVRPTLRFPDGMAAKARLLAFSGVAIVGAQWVAFALAIRLANVNGPNGAVIILTLAWTVFLLPWAVLVIPISTSVFPQLSGQFGRGDHEGFAATTAGSLRVVVLAAALGAAGLAAVAPPVAELMVSGVPGKASVAALAATLTAFAPGVLGFGVHGHLSRVLAARHASQLAAAVSVTGWAVGAGLAAWLARAAAGRGDSDVVIAGIAVAFSIALLLMGAALVVAVARTSGRAALRGFTRSATAAVVAGGVSVVVGRALADRWSAVGVAEAALVSALVGGLVVVVFLGVAAAIDRESARAVLGRLRPGRVAGVATGVGDRD